MNQYAAYAQSVPGGYRVMLRFCRDAKPKPLLGKGGAPVVFETESGAWHACTKHLLDFMNGTPVRGERFETTGLMTEAEALFDFSRIGAA